MTANETCDRVAAAAANVEQVVSNAPLGAEEVPRFTAPVRCHIHSVRKRLADVDGVSGKAVLDGIVKAGLLADDSPEFVREVRFSQEKGGEEMTIITIETEDERA